MSGLRQLQGTPPWVSQDILPTDSVQTPTRGPETVLEGSRHALGLNIDHGMTTSDMRSSAKVNGSPAGR
jgi:hypothetical protein